MPRLGSVILSADDLGMTKRQLKAAIAAAREGNGRGRYSAGLKAAIIKHARQEHAQGTTWTRVAKSLGLNPSQLHQWSVGSRGRRGRLQPVVVVAPSQDAPASTTALRLELPGGGAVTGLSLRDVAQLLEALR